MNRTPNEAWHALCRGLTDMAQADDRMNTDPHDDDAPRDFDRAADSVLAAFRDLRDHTSFFDEAVGVLAATYGGMPQ